MPVGRFHYLATRQPIVLDWWRPSSAVSVNGNPLSSAGCFTTVANWRQSDKDFDWNGETYTWSKHHEFLKFIDLPYRTAQPLELAIALKSKTDEEQGAWAFTARRTPRPYACSLGTAGVSLMPCLYQKKYCLTAITS